MSSRFSWVSSSGIELVRGVRDEPFDKISVEIFILIRIVFVTDNRIWLTDLH